MQQSQYPGRGSQKYKRKEISKKDIWAQSSKKDNSKDIYIQLVAKQRVIETVLKDHGHYKENYNGSLWIYTKRYYPEEKQS